MPRQKDIVNALEKEGIRNQVKVIFGGAPCTPEWVKEIGGDAFGASAMEGVRVAKQLLGIAA
jgi:methanogenic corrinoid protein MtbC1